MSQKFDFIPAPYIGGQLTDSKPEQKFEGEYDIIYECIQTVSYTHLTLPTNREV